MTEQLTAEQRKTIRELQAELKELNLKADIEWAKYIHTGDEECFNEVLALDSEREMKGLVAYIPKAGELKVSKVRQLVTKIKNLGGEACEDCELDEPNEVRLGALDSVNEWRASYDLPPLVRLPRGVPGDPAECTLAQAFKVSLSELGVVDGYVEVTHSDDIRLTGEKDGRYWVESPGLSNASDALIQNFDENAYLDLIADSALKYLAERLIEDADDGFEVDIERMQEISDELALRGIQYELPYSGVRIGRGTDPLRAKDFGDEENEED